MRVLDVFGEQHPGEYEHELHDVGCRHPIEILKDRGAQLAQVTGYGGCLHDRLNLGDGLRGEYIILNPVRDDCLRDTLPQMVQAYRWVPVRQADEWGPLQFRAPWPWG